MKPEYIGTTGIVIILLLSGSMLYAQDAPELPAGLPSSPSADDQPALPSGLGIEPADTNDFDTEPSLPSGLETATSLDLTETETKQPKKAWMDVTGFWEMRSGYRLRNDEHEKDASIGETRLQLEMQKNIEDFTFELTTDLYYDWVSENLSVDLERGEGFLDLREASLAYRFDFMDLKLGRQVLTWGTGDLLFINDLFPKDWQSFFIGRDTEYLKAPSDAAKISLFSDLANLDIVYTPQFDSDRFISGESISYWNSNLGRLAGRDAIQHRNSFVQEYQ